MKKFVLALSSMFIITSCDKVGINNSDLQGKWNFTEWTVEEFGNVNRGTFSNSSDSIVYNFEMPSTVGYFYWEVYENGTPRGTSSDYEYQIIGDSLFVPSLNNSSSAWSSKYEIVNLTQNELTLSWYSELPNKNEKTTILLKKIN